MVALNVTCAVGSYKLVIYEFCASIPYPVLPLVGWFVVWFGTMGAVFEFGAALFGGVPTVVVDDPVLLLFVWVFELLSPPFPASSVSAPPWSATV